MENNYNQDKFEDFLKKTLKNYEENPSDALWDKIDASAAWQKPPANRSVFSKKIIFITSVAAVSMLAIGLFMLQQSKTIAQLQTDLATQKTNLERVETEQKSSENKSESIKITPNSVEKISIQPIEKTTVEQLAFAADMAKKSSVQSTMLNNSNFNAVTNYKNNIEKNIRSTDAKPTASNSNTVVNEQIIETKKDNFFNNQLTINNLEQNETPKNLEIIAPEKAAERKNEIINFLQKINNTDIVNTDKKSLELDIQKIIHPVSQVFKRQNWYVGVQSQIGDRYFDKKDSGRHHQNNQVENRPDDMGSFFSYGVTIGKNIGKRWSLESGLELLNFQHLASNNPKLNFREPHGNGPHGGGGHGDDDDFEDISYNIASSAGDAKVTIRVNQTDTSVQLPKNTPIDIQVVTQESERKLSIPLTAKYRFAVGQFHFFTLAGLSLDCSISRNLNVSAAQSNSNFFETNHREKTEVVFSSNQPFAASYRLGLGVEWKFARNYSLEFIANRREDLLRFDAANTSRRGSQIMSAGLSLKYFL